GVSRRQTLPRAWPADSRSALDPTTERGSGLDALAARTRALDVAQSVLCWDLCVWADEESLAHLAWRSAPHQSPQSARAPRGLAHRPARSSCGLSQLGTVCEQCSTTR